MQQKRDRPYIGVSDLVDHCKIMRSNIFSRKYFESCWSPRDAYKGLRDWSRLQSLRGWRYDCWIVVCINIVNLKLFLRSFYYEKTSDDSADL